MSASVQQAEQALRAEFRSLALARTDFPMLTAWGVEDFSHTIHSLGCNYLTAVGREAGFWAVSDYPVRVAGARANRSVRPDVAWWARPGGEAVVLGEFERAETPAPRQARGKGPQPARSAHALGERPRLLLLVGWALAGTDLGDLGTVRAVMASGYRADDGTPVPGLEPDSVFVLATAVFGDVDGERRLLRVLA